MTAASLVGAFGWTVQEMARVTVEHNLAHLIASDGHSLVDRPPLLSEAVEYASAIVGGEVATAMVTSIPEAITDNRVPRLLEPIPVRRKKGWFI